MTIQQAVKNFKDLIEDAIKEGGNEAKTAMIRSSESLIFYTLLTVFITFNYYHHPFEG